jgi:hypothetical protein
VIDMTNRPDVAMRLRPVEFFLGHHASRRFTLSDVRLPPRTHQKHGQTAALCSCESSKVKHASGTGKAPWAPLDHALIASSDRFWNGAPGHSITASAR